MKLTMVSIALLLASSFGSAADVPPYPYAEPRWRPALVKRLEKKISVSTDGSTVREVLESIGKQIGTTIVSDLLNDSDLDRKITISFKDLAASSIIRFCLASCGSTASLIVAKKRVIVTDEPEKYPGVKAMRTRSTIESVRSSRFPTKKERAAREAHEAERKKAVAARERTTKRIRKALRGSHLDLKIEKATLRDALGTLQQLSGVSIFLAADSAKLGGRRVSLRGGKKRTLGAALAEIVESVGLAYHIRKGTLIVDTKANIEKARPRRSRKSEKRRAEEEKSRQALLAKPLGVKIRGRGCIGEIVEALSKGLSVEIRADEGSWNTRVSFPGFITSMTLAELAKRLKRKKVETVVLPDKAAYAEGRLEWIVYLLKPDPR
jgi:hypothetical protein